MKQSKLEKKLSAKSIRQHYRNEMHQWCRIVDYYVKEQKMCISDAAYCAEKKFERLYRDGKD